MTATKKRTFLLCGLAVTAIVITGFIPNSLSDAFLRKYGDMMDWRSSWLVGPNSVNCGRVTMGEEHPWDPPVTTCGIQSLVTKRPFRLRYDIGDTSLAVAVVRKADGRLYALSFIGEVPHSGDRRLRFSYAPGKNSS